MTTNGFGAAAAFVISTSAALMLGGCAAPANDPSGNSTTSAETNGAPVTAGADGANGASGATGPAGPTGASGADGTNGANGARGPVGTPGPTGAHGTPGLTSLVNVTSLPAGDEHCPQGGIQIDSGVDDDRDGTLEPGEIDATTYSCTGGASRKRIVFVTSQSFDGNLGGIAGADAKCMAAAAGQTALSGKTFRAWVSSSSASPASSFTSDGAFVTVGGDRIADTFNNLREGTLMTKITSETGASISTPVWTGTDENGYDEADADCNGWTSADAGGDGTQSSSDTIQWYWSSSGMTSCDHQAALYCFEQ